MNICYPLKTKSRRSPKSSACKTPQKLQEAEDRYLPRGAEDTCASCSPHPAAMNWGNSPNTTPKRWSTSKAHQSSPTLSTPTMRWASKDIVVVRGYKKEAVNLPNLTYVDNNDFAETGELDSLLKPSDPAKERLKIQSFLRRRAVQQIYSPVSLSGNGMTVSIFVDSNCRNRPAMPAWVGLPNAPFPIRENPLTPRSISSDWGTTSQRIHPRVWMGFLKVSPGAASHITNIIVEMLAKPANRKAGIPQLLQELLKRHVSRPRALHSRALARYQQYRGCGPGRKLLVGCLWFIWSVWSIWLVWFVWFSLNKTNKINLKPDKLSRRAFFAVDLPAIDC